MQRSVQEATTNTHPLFSSVVVCVVLFVSLLVIWILFPIPPAYQKDVLFLTIVFCIGLISITVFQALKISESAHSLAEGMAKDILVYSHDLFSELYRNSPVPYVLVAEDGTVESMNLATARLFNVELDALNTLNIFSFIGGEDTNKIALIPEYFRQGRAVSDSEVSIQCPDGSLKWVMLSLFSFNDAKNVHKGLLTLVDITKQKQIDKAKTEFVSLASHQLRTPISGMKWNIELLSAGKDHFTPQEVAYIDKIGAGLSRMDMLVGDFLSVSRFELGTLTTEYTQVDLIPFLESIYEEHSPAAEKKNVRLETDWNQAAGNINCDSHLLHMIVSNLVSNAVKYTPTNGTVRVHVSRDNEHYTFVVSDTGMGIPEKEQEMLFSKMFRASNARAQVTDGNGLGLYIVKEAAETLKGKISFESKEGVGTTFTVVLPV